VFNLTGDHPHFAQPLLRREGLFVRALVEALPKTASRMILEPCSAGSVIPNVT
jgi:hypothetical protein